MQISSSHNEKIKKLIKLQQKSRERKITSSFVVEGIQENRLALKNSFKPLQLFVQSDLFKNSIELPDVETYEITREIFDKITYRSSTGGIVGIYEVKTFDLNTLEDKEKPLIVVLEAVEKPGNLGAILRTCDAAHVDAVIVCDKLVDFFNPNVIRSSVGTLFTNTLISCSKEELYEFCNRNEIQICATYLREDTQNLYDLDLSKATALVYGTESTGLSGFWTEKSDVTIKIPMLGQVDSLNVSNAVAISVYEAVRQRAFS